MEEYDNVFQKLNEYNVLMSKIVTWIMLAIAGMLTLFPYQVIENESKVMAFFAFNFMNVTVLMYMNAYTNVVEKGKTISVFQKLKYMPIDPKVVFQSRRKLLLRFLGKMTAIFQLLQLLSAIVFCHEVIVMNFYPLFAGVFVALLWMASLHHRMRRTG